MSTECNHCYCTVVYVNNIKHLKCCNCGNTQKFISRFGFPNSTGDSNPFCSHINCNCCKLIGPGDDWYVTLRSDASDLYSIL